QGAGRLRGDAVPLQARLGEDQRLRRGRHVQLLQQRAEVAGLVIEVKAELAVEAFLQARDGVVRLGSAVVDRLAVEVVGAGWGRQQARQQQSDELPVCR